MHTPDLQSFLAKATKGVIIPVWRELAADQESPLYAYERLRIHLQENNRPLNLFLLDSIEGGEHLARYSFLGADPRAIVQSVGKRTTVFYRNASSEVLPESDPLLALKNYLARFRFLADTALPRFFSGGAVGYLSYDAVRHFERVPLSAEQDHHWPDMMFAITDTLLIFDRVRHTIKVVANAFVEDDPTAAYTDAVGRIDKICAALVTPLPQYLIDLNDPIPQPATSSNLTAAEYGAIVDQAKEYIRAGDIIQVVLSQRFKLQNTATAPDVYRAVRSINPSPYMYCLEFGLRGLVGSSPELHVRCENGQVESRPIAGTRPRGETPEEDLRLAGELLQDPKECAEHVMLVDLARNDLGRICTYGSVKVPEFMTIERYSHVMHIVSAVTGQLAKEHDIFDVMRATFPAGTVSGAPKIRAMEIIAELEKIKRGPYAGAVCYFSFSGNLDSCITIRTAMLEGDHAYVQAGAGIVADSQPEREYEETCNKAQSMLKALALAQQYSARRKEEGDLQ